MRRIIVSFFVGLIAFVFITQDALSIPAFARKYQFSCTTCHFPFPKLKEYGDEFAANGFTLPDKEPIRYFFDVGDPDLLLMRRLPLAVRVDLFATAEPDGTAETDLKTPYNIKLLSGGSIYKWVGYYFYFYLSEKGEVVGVEDAYLHFNNLFNTELDLMVGQFQISDPLFKRELRLTFEDYQVYKTRVGFSVANLTYDRGLFFTYSSPFHTDFAAEVVNGNGKDPASEGDNVYDDNGNKNLFLRASQSFMGQRVGAFTYFGKEESLDRKNDFTYWGVDATFSAPKIELNLQYLNRKDTNPLFRIFAQENNLKGGFAELIVSPTDKLFFIGLYNRQYSDLVHLNYTTFTTNVSYLLLTNMRILSELTLDLERESSRFLLGLVTAF